MSTIFWKGDTPVSPHFDDIYFSVEDGLAESSFVFLENNNLEQRFKSVTDQFVIGELGFGTGLNFLNTVRLWQRCAPETATLHYYAVEKYPLSPADIERALRVWSPLHNLIDIFVAQYPKILMSEYSLIFKNIYLSIFCEDILAGLPRITQPINAWYGDGFAPAKNPEMWSSEVFQQMAEKSAPQTTFSTFSAARLVRDNATAAGFTVEKIKGFGRKRTMLRGHL
jgi:tRNA 5-methylaminomethyl-2-thiouridine biosynthesis bifunctional protein